MKSLVSIVNWNSSAATNVCLAGIAALPKAEQPDIVVVDNGSARDKLKIDPSLEKQLRSLAVIANKENLGFAGGHNPNIKKAVQGGYDYIILLNPDTEIIDSSLFKILVDTLEANPKALGANPTILQSVSPNIIWYAGGVLSLRTSRVSHVGVGDIEDPHGKAKNVSFLTGCCLAISLKRASIEQLLLPEAYFLYWEDAEWSARAAKAGFDLLYVPRARLLHHVSDSLGVRSPAYVYYNIRNHFLFVRHNISPVFWLPCWLRIGVISLKYKAVIILRYRQGKLLALRAVWRAWRDGISGTTGPMKRSA